MNTQADLPKGMSIAALATGIAGFIFCCIPIGIAGLPISFIAHKKCKQGEADGQGMALAGMILNGISLVLWILYIIFNVILGVGSVLMAPEIIDYFY